MFSAYQEAFDNPIKQQREQLEREMKQEMKKQELINSVEENQRKFGLTAPHYYEPPNDELEFGEGMGLDGSGASSEPVEGLGIDGTDHMSLQGVDMDGMTWAGDNDTTSLTLKSPGSRSSSSLGSIGDSDSEFSEASSDGTLSLTIRTPPKRAKKRVKSISKQKNQTVYQTHDYYISRFIDDMYQGGSKLPDQYEVYQHVTACNYCKDSIKKKISELHMPIEQVSTLPEMPKPTPIKPTSTQVVAKAGWRGSDIKDVILLVIVGIVVIFLLDLVVKIRQTV